MINAGKIDSKWIVPRAEHTLPRPAGFNGGFFSAPDREARPLLRVFKIGLQISVEDDSSATHPTRP